jgi:hypothetical protein
MKSMPVGTITNLKPRDEYPASAAEAHQVFNTVRDAMQGDFSLAPASLAAFAAINNGVLPDGSLANNAMRCAE